MLTCLQEALKKAVKSGNKSSVKQLLHSHPNLLSWRDARGWSCLHWAAGFGSTDIVKCLQTEYHMDPLDTANVSKHHIPTDFVITAEIYVQMFCNPLMSNDKNMF